MITKESVATKLTDYLNRRTTLAELVDWAENALMDAEFAAENVEVLADMVARIGTADVRQFGLTWEECDEILRRLGFDARVEVSPA